jgi:hypothetical protein
MDHTSIYMVYLVGSRKDGLWFQDTEINNIKYSLNGIM